MTKETRIYNGERTASSIIGVGETPIYKRIKPDYFLTS